MGTIIAVSFLVLPFVLFCLGLLILIDGILLAFFPDRWARVPGILRLAPKLNVGIAWSNARSSIVMRRVLGLFYFGVGSILVCWTLRLAQYWIVGYLGMPRRIQ